MPPVLLYDMQSLDLTHIEADREAILAINPQRFEMEQLDAIVFSDPNLKVVVGYKDVRPDEFWVRGHMPGYPLFPGVLICEASAQLCSYYFTKHHVMSGDFLGFGGLENVRFRVPVHPGDRLILVAKVVKVHRRQIISNVQGFVGDTMVFHGDFIGMPLSNRTETGA